MQQAGVSFKDTWKYKELATYLRENAGEFAAFKNHAEQRELAKLMLDENGKPRTFSQFKKAARPITEQYNINWLQTEYNQATAQSQMAIKWEGFKEDADLYPNLEYRAVQDKRTRDEHAKMHGIVLPINDPFWNTNYPPNGWGCRCTVVQTDKKVRKPKTDIEPDKGFDHNSGKDRKLFADKNGYTENVSAKERSAIKREAKKLLKNE